MPVITVRVTPEQSSWIESQARGYVKKADVVRGLIDQAISSDPCPFTPVPPPATLSGKGGRGEGAYSPLTNNPLGSEQPLVLLETAIRNPLHPLTEKTTCGIKGVQGEKDQSAPDTHNATNPTAAKPPSPAFERFNPTPQDVPEHLSEAAESLLDFWEQKSGRATHRAWVSLLTNCDKILRDKRGSMDILRAELDSATQGGFRGLNYERWLAYGVKTDSGTFQGRRGAFEEDLSNHPAYKPFDAPWLHE